VSRDYAGFAFKGPGRTRSNDVVIRPLQPDVAHLLERIKSLNLPSIDTMTVQEARAFALTMASARPPGPAVGAITDGVLPGAAGDLAYRLYRPASPAPHPVVVYFHGGGWVLGSHDSDDPFCRDLCVRSGAVIVSVGYRHAPEARFPAAVDDAFAAIQWIAANAAALGAEPGRIAVCGYSAGGNIAAVVCQMARDAGGPRIAGQVLVTPVTDCDLTRASYAANAEGYVLTASAMRWFWDHYADPADRKHPKASPLRAADLSNLPPALVVTSEFDPLRDEGAAYARAMTAAGVQVRHLACRGQIHTSLTAVDIVMSAGAARQEMAVALREFLSSSFVTNENSDGIDDCRRGL
jgi:acetyl esterase/lipase